MANHAELIERAERYAWSKDLGVEDVGALQSLLLETATALRVQPAGVKVRGLIDFICDDVLPSYDISSEIGRNDPELAAAVGAFLSALGPAALSKQEAVADGEANYQAYRLKQEVELADEPADLEATLRMLERWGPEALPANDQGQVHFARALIDSAASAIRKHLASPVPAEPPARPTGHVEITHDGFAGDIIGHYVTREGKRGVVVQQDRTRVVHVYGEKWLPLGGV